MPTLPPPDMPQAEPPKDIPGIFAALKEVLSQAEQSAGGYFVLSAIYAQVLQQGKVAGRRRGLPVMEYRGTLDGVNVLPLKCDLSKIPLKYLPSMLATMCNVHAAELLDGLQKMQNLTQDALIIVRTALGMEASKSTAQPSAADEHDGEGEEVVD
jgi:hypothetical protein